MKRASSPTNNLEKYQPKKRKNRRSGFAGIAGSRIPTHLSQTQNPLDLTVFGHRCKIHSDDEMAKQIDEGKHLIDYFGGDQGQGHGHGLSPRQGIVGEYAADREEEEQQEAKQKQHQHLHLHVPYMENLEEDLFGNSSSLNQDAGAERPILLDRYDVRTLLENLEELEKPAGIHSGTDSDSRKFSLQIKEHKLETLSHEYEIEYGYDGYGDDDILDEDTRRLINRERYSDLNSSACVEGDQVHVETIHGSIGSNEQKQTPPDGSDMNDLKECTSGVELEGEEKINIHVLAPNGVRVPKTRREYNIIKFTAERVRSTTQFEVLLKVKESNNPDFDFLKETHALNPFYQWMKDEHDEHEHEHEQIRGSVDSTCSGKEMKQETLKEEDNAMGLLNLNMYGSSSSDDESDNELGIQHTVPTNNQHTNKKVEEPKTNNSTRSTIAQTEMSSDMKVLKVGVETTDVAVAAGSSNVNIAIVDKRARRLKRAKMMKHHFAKR